MEIDKFCKKYELGDVLSTQKILGGRMHQMFKAETTTGVYAIKVLNKEVMRRKEAYHNLIQSEKIATFVKNAGILVSNALLIQGNVINSLNGNYYMVFEFIEGKTLTSKEITLDHCKKIGKVLAQIHALDFSKLGLKEELIEYSRLYSWEEYIKNENFQNMEYRDLFLKNYKKYNSLLKRANERYNKGNTILTICHRDLDPKNVLWKDNEPIIIDWESAELMNPYRELIEVAFSWSFLNHQLDEEKFSTIISEYTKYREFKHHRYSIICGNLVGRFGWLKYNLERSLGILSDDLEEKKLAEEEVSKTILEINKYQELIGSMYQMVCKITKKEVEKYHPVIEKLIEKEPLLKGKAYEKLNAGFSNTCYKVGNYIVRICTSFENEQKFEREMEFYKNHQQNLQIPKCYKVDSSKTVIPYEYEIIERIEGKTLYKIWYQLSETERKEMTIKIINAIKSIHQIKVEPYDFKEYLKEEFRKLLNDHPVEKNILSKLLILCEKYFQENHFGLIHGDLHFDNLIYHQDKIYIIDFERVMIAPIDYDFTILDQCSYQPWKWANEEDDMLTIEDDYQSLLPTIIENYEELRKIKYLRQRLNIYLILSELKEYKRTKNTRILSEIDQKLTDLT